MKKSDELKQKRTGLEAEMEKLVSKENRTAEETTSLEEKHNELEALNKQIEFEEKNERLLATMAGRSGQVISKNEEKDLGKYSFYRAIKLLAAGKPVDGLEGEMHEEGLKERSALGLKSEGFTVPVMVLDSRASTGQNVTTAADGGNLVQEDKLHFFEALKNAMVLYQLGATFHAGLVGDFPLVQGGAFSASWVAEGSEVSTTKMATSKVIMKPKNLMVAGAISKQLLAQTAGTAESMVRNELIAAMAQGLQNAAINGSGTGATPTGILNYTGIGAVAGGDNGLAPTWAHIVNLESEVANDNAVFRNPAYLTNTKVRGKLKQTLKASNVAGYIWDGEGMNGYKSHVTNAVPSTLDKGSSTGVCSAIVFGYFSELFMGMWGGLDLIVDPYSLKKKSEIELVFNQFADVALRNPESFAAMKDVLTV